MLRMRHQYSINNNLPPSTGFGCSTASAVKKSGKRAPSSHREGRGILTTEEEELMENGGEVGRLLTIWVIDFGKVFASSSTTLFILDHGVDEHRRNFYLA